MRQFFIAGVLLICVFGCNERHKIVFSAKYIVDIHNPLEISLDDFITDIDTIRLEATDESLIKDIYQIQIMDGRIYMSVNNSTALFIHDLTGKYITQINDRGQGPNEYLTITCFYLDPVNKRIVITDNLSKRILIYDKDGKQIDVIKLNFHPMFVVPYKNGYFNSCTGFKNYYNNPKMDDYHINFLDSTGVFISSALKKENKNTVAMTSNERINILKDGDILYRPPLCNIVYKMHDNDIFPYYEFNNLSKFKFLSDKESRDFEYIVGEENTIKEKEERGYLLTWGTFFEADDFVIFYFNGDDIYHLLYYDKKSSKSWFIDPLTLKGDEKSIDFFIRYVRAVSDSRIYIAPSPDYIYYELKGNIKIKDEKVQQFLDNMDEDSNPILLSYKIKFPE